MKKLSITVEGKRHSWSFNFYGNPRYLEEWRADGLQIDEVVNSIPLWAQEMGLTNIWFFLQDLFNFNWIKKKK